MIVMYCSQMTRVTPHYTLLRNGTSAGSCQAPERQYFCILVLRKLVSHDLIQKISQLPVSEFLSNCMKNISLIDRGVKWQVYMSTLLFCVQ